MIVVGSGATGGIAAYSYAKAGVRVLIVEAGEQLTPKQAIGSEPLNTVNRFRNLITQDHLIQAQHPGYWKANPLLYSSERENPYTYPPNQPFLWTQGNQVGGRSLTWGGITLRLSEYELKSSKIDGFGSDWPINYEEISPHYSHIEAMLKVHGNKDRLKHLPDGNFIDPLPFSSSEISFSKSIKNEFDFPFIHSRGFDIHDARNNKSWPKYSSLGSTLKEAVQTGNVEILSNHIVEKIVMNKNIEKAKGIITVNKKNGAKELINGKIIVLCASTIQSLRILLSSESKNTPNGFIDSSGELGCYVMDHVSTSRFFTLPYNSKSNNTKKYSLSGAGSFFIPFGSHFEGTLTSDFIRGYGLWGGIDRLNIPNFLKRIGDSAIGFLIGHGEVLAKKTNRVSLSSKLNHWEIPCPHIDVRWGDNEYKMVSHMQNTINQLVQIAGGKVLPLKDIIKMPFVEPLVHNSYALSEGPPPPGYYIHEVGGAAMGTKESNSVVDPLNRLWRCKNVLVVDGACWPSSGWQSPTLTMMAITRRACLESLKPHNE